MDVPVGVAPSPVRSYLGVVLRRIGVIVVVIVVFTGLSLVYTMRQPSVYEASSRVRLQGTLAEQILAGGQSNELALLLNDVGDTEIQIMQSPGIVQAVADELGHVPSVSISRVGTSTIVLITATASTGTDAARDATTFAHVYVTERKQTQLDQFVEASTQFQAQIADLDDQLATIQAPLRELDTGIAASTDTNELARLQARRQALEQKLAPEVASITSRRTTYAGQLDRLQLAINSTVTGGAQVVANAVEPSSPVAPRPVRSGLIALGLSLVIGIALAFLFEQLDDNIRSKTQLEQLTGLMTIGLIPSVASWRNGKEQEMVSVGGESFPAAEAFSSLGASVRFIGINRAAAVIQITSALTSEGKTTTAANLAVSLARGGKRVVLVDSDLRRPRLHKLFELPGGQGLTSVLLGEITLSEAVQPVPGEQRLALLSSGEIPPDPHGVLMLDGYADIISTLRHAIDYVIIDSPPILPVVDARIISAIVDVTLMVVSANSSAEKHIVRSLELLQQADARVAGTVLNNIPRRGRYSLSYGYWYSYDARPGPKHRNPTPSKVTTRD